MMVPSIPTPAPDKPTSYVEIRDRAHFIGLLQAWIVKKKAEYKEMSWVGQWWSSFPKRKEAIELLIQKLNKNPTIEYTLDDIAFACLETKSWVNSSRLYDILASYYWELDEKMKKSQQVINLSVLNSSASG